MKLKLNAQIEVGKTHLMSIERFVPLNSIKSSLFVFNSQLAQLIRTLTRSPHTLHQYQIRFHQQTKWKIHSERASNERNERNERNTRSARTKSVEILVERGVHELFYRLHYAVWRLQIDGHHPDAL